MAKTSGRVNKDASFLRDAIFAANDGVVTTFAVISGSLGANLGANVVVILGFANLFADGFSMASGIYLGSKSESDFEKKRGNAHWKQDAPLAQGLVTFISFVVSGFVPLIPFVFKMDNPFKNSVVFVILFLLLVGALKGRFSGKSMIRGAGEMLMVGGLASTVAYLVGFFVDRFLI
jgi:VIT1/CCC1 family predicted Fe2+/Mn2+ transporter